MKTAIVGSRAINDYEELKRLLQSEEITEVISGGANGVDKLAERWATENNKPVTIIRPDYTRYGKGATMVRNAEIVKLADQVIAFWDGESLGTQAIIKMARKAEKPTKVHILKPKQANDDKQMSLF